MAISDEIRENIRKAEQAERERLQRLAHAADVRDGVIAGAAARAAAARAAEQERERAAQERERRRLARIEAEARQQARLGWVGSDADFNAAWPALWQQYQIDRAAEALTNGQIAARAATKRAF